MKGAGLVGAALLLATPIQSAGADECQLSFIPRGNDATGHFMGGTELRQLVVHQGKLYAANGYWEDRPGAEGVQGSQILVLDAPAAGWRVEHVFGDRLPRGAYRDFVVSTLTSVRFATDGTGAALPGAVPMLVASTWDRTGMSRVFTRDEATGAWSATVLAQDPPQPNFLPQIRSFGFHRDRRTGVDRIFAGHSPRGIFSGVYDAAAKRIRWDPQSEFDFAMASRDANPGTADWLRADSFAEANGVLYASVGQQIFVRDDGNRPAWRLVYTNPKPGHSETGLRGLTAIANPKGGGQVLLATVEGNASRIIRVDPADGTVTSELDLVDFLAKAWGVRATYVIAAYNDMARVPEPPRGEALVIGLESFIPRPATLPPGQSSVDVGYGRLEAGGWYLIRHPDARYELKQIVLPPAQTRDLVAVRTAIASPFAGETGVLYLGGYDANKAAAHNTAWIARTRPAP